MGRQNIFGSAKSETIALDGSSDAAGSMCLKRLAVASAALILGGALSACQPIPQSYYDWLAAGGGYYDGYAPLFHGRFVNECPLHEVNPRECRVHDPTAMGQSGRGFEGSSVGALSAHGLGRGSNTGAMGHAAAHGGAHGSSGGHGGGGHGGHGGR
jgi:hypothetical protein